MGPRRNGAIARIASLCMLIAVFALPSAWAQPLLSREQFRDRVVEEARRTYPTATVAPVGELAFSAKGLPTGVDLNANLDNAYALYAADPETLADIVGRHVRALAVTDEAVGDERSRVVAIIRHRDLLAAFRGRDPVWRPFVGDLVEIIAIDSAETIMIPPVNVLAGYGVTADEAWALAASNLRARLGPLRIGALEEGSTVVVVAADSGLAPSILSDPAFCTAGEPDRFYFLLSREAFVSADSSLPGAEADFRRAVQELRRGQTASDTPFVCRGGEYVVMER